MAFGVRRLSIVDVEGGHQPFSNEDGTVWACQNGELYNHDGAPATSSPPCGHRFASRCDTEILPHLYEEMGDDFPEQLRGMFGIAVWDDRRRRAVLARDRLGIKPLYYAEVGDLLVFASELKSLLASGLDSAGPRLRGDRRLPDASASSRRPTTPLAAVRKLLPGHRLVVEDGRVSRRRRYWSYPEPALADPSPARARLCASVSSPSSTSRCACA